jgi:hypothetical protein
MNRYRPAAVTLAACLVSLSLAACTTGITTASTATTSPAAPASSASASASASASLAAGRMIQVSGKVGSFPVPPGAKIDQNVASSQETIVFFTLITPANVSSFYARALPQAGYTITNNSVFSQSGSTVAFVQFTGHGFKGNIDALSKFTDSTVSLAGVGHKNVTTITFTPK